VNKHGEYKYGLQFLSAHEYMDEESLQQTVETMPKTDKSIGLDVGITSLIATSNGDKIANPKHFKRLRSKRVFEKSDKL